MKKILPLLLTVLSLLMIFDSINLGHALVMFLLAGVIPGTNIAVGADHMLIGFALLIGFILSRLTVQLFALRTRSTEVLLFDRHNTLSPKL